MSKLEIKAPVMLNGELQPFPGGTGGWLISSAGGECKPAPPARKAIRLQGGDRILPDGTLIRLGKFPMGKVALK
jgi:hypothetical protein